MKRIQETELENKRILLRVDFNVAVEGEKVKEIFKIAAAKETIDYLLTKRGKIALISHLGRPEGKIDPKFSLAQLKTEVENLSLIHI